MIGEAIQSIIHNEFYIKSGNGPSIQRNVFENVEYDDYETKQIQALQEKIQQKGLNIKLKKSTLLKMLMAAQYDIEKAIINCQFHLKFLKEYKKVDFSKEYSRGLVYVCGFDNQYRPVIVFRQYCDIKIIAYFLETVKRQLLIDYYVENWTIIIDLDLDLPILELEDLLQLQLHFYGNLNKILITNGPDDIEQIAKQFTDKFQDLKSKMRIITENTQLLQFIPKEQLEIKYGGSLPNCDTFWPMMKRDGQFCISNKASHLSALSINSSSVNNVNKKSSFMKITVLEENGNPLMNQQLEVDDFVQSSDSSVGHHNHQNRVSEEMDKLKTYQSSNTKKQFIDQEELMNMDDEEENGEKKILSQNQKIKKHMTETTKKLGDVSKTFSYSQRPTILEGDKEIPTTYSSCCSRNCKIF